MKSHRFLIAVAAIVLITSSFFILDFFHHTAPLSTEGSSEVNAQKGNAEPPNLAPQEAPIKDVKKERTRVVLLASRPAVDTSAPRSSNGAFMVGSGKNSRIVNASGDVIFRPGSERLLAGIELNASGSLAKLSFGESPFIEIFSLPTFNKIASIAIKDSPSEVEWRWLSDRLLIGIKNSSGGDHHHKQSVTEKTDLYIFNLDRNRVEGPILMPPNLPTEFELAEIGPASTVQLLAQEKGTVRELWVAIQPPTE